PATATKQFTNVNPGTSTVSEDAAAGWNLTGLNCVDPTSDSSGDTGARTATIKVGVSETVTCTFTNVKPPKLTVNKVCVPANDAGKFNLQIDGPTAGTGANAACGGTTGAATSTIATH